MNIQELIQYIELNIKANGIRSITGTVLQQILVEICENMTPSEVSKPLKISDPLPIENGIYLALESGLYSNGITVDLNNGITYLILDEGIWSSAVYPVNLVPTGVVEEGNTEAVSGGEVFEKLQKTKINKWTAQPYTAGQQVLENDLWYEAVVNTTSEQQPGEVDETIWKPIGGARILQTKNIFDNNFLSGRIVNRAGEAVISSGTPERVATSFIPVEFGKSYTISGLPSGYGVPVNNKVIAGTATAENGPFVKQLGTYDTTGIITVDIDDPAINFMIIQVGWSVNQIFDDIDNRVLQIQVEEGTAATDYIPNKLVETGDEILSTAISTSKAYTDSKDKYLYNNRLRQFEVMNTYNDRYQNTSLGSVTLTPSPVGGVRYSLLQGDDLNAECLSNNLFGIASNIKPGVYNLYAYLANYDKSGQIQAVKINATPFEIPSGQMDNEPTEINTERNNKDDYCHPSIGYNPTGVGGYKYWMVTSILPASTIETGAAQEDEDLFVTNTPEDHTSWKRVRSLYENDKSYTTTTLRLPPVPDTWSTNARRNAFLPIPKSGVSVEISCPADNGYGALDRVTKVISSLPYKHDPALCFHGGYVYILHSFHLYYQGEQYLSKFVVLTRTSDGVNWESVRPDGTTYALDSEEKVSRLFTKDENGIYNYWFYGYRDGRTNPEFVVYGENDVDLLWGENFNQRYHGTTPFNIDLTNNLGIQSLGSGNHPGVVYSPSTGLLYCINANLFAYSSNRGASFTVYTYQPNWIGGSEGLSYKKTMCIGEGGKVILFDVKRIVTKNPTSPNPGLFAQTFRIHKMFAQIYPSIATMVDYATNGLDDGYIDIHIDKINYGTGAKTTYFLPYKGATATTGGANTPMQRTDLKQVIQVDEGDELHVTITLNRRTGGVSFFSGLEFS